MKYKRILLKLSGEALAGQKGTGICPDTLKNLSGEIKKLIEMGVEVGIVIGGGNIHRGVAGATEGMDRTSSDHMGMLATIINSITLQDHLEKLGVFTKILTAIEIKKLAEPYIRRHAVRHLEKKRVVIFAGGTGNPYFTTDTAAALRASEINTNIIIKATKVNGIYNKDPIKHNNAVKFDSLSYIDVINKGIKVMDSTAITFCMDNEIDIIIFNVFEEENIQKVALSNKIKTIVTKS